MTAAAAKHDAALIAAVSSAIAASKAAETKVVDARGKLARLQIDERAARTRLLEAGAADAEKMAAKLLDDDFDQLKMGEPIAPGVERELAGYSVAIATQTQVVTAAEKELGDARAASSAPVLALSNAMQERAIGGAQTAFANAVPHLAQLIAVDQLTSRLLGERYPIPAGSKAPLGGAQLLATILRELPAPFRSAALQRDSIVTAARAVTASTLKLIDKENA